MSLSSKHQIKARYGLIDLGLLALLNPATSILAIPSLESYRPALTKQLAHFWFLGSGFSRAKNSGVSHLFGMCFPRNTGKAAKEAFSSHWPPGVIGAGSSEQSINHASHCVHGGQGSGGLGPTAPICRRVRAASRGINSPTWFRLALACAELLRSENKALGWRALGIAESSLQGEEKGARGQGTDSACGSPNSHGMPASCII